MRKAYKYLENMQFYHIFASQNTRIGLMNKLLTYIQPHTPLRIYLTFGHRSASVHWFSGFQ